jgi:hypothetical protein
MQDWIKDHQQIFWWLGSVSLLTLVISLVFLPIVVTRMRSDYFLPDRDEERSFAHQHPAVRWTGLILKNLFGGILFVAGILMLGLPGQGILTILMGLMLLDFPGKQRLELWLVRLPAVELALNWIRKKNDRPPLEIPSRTAASESLDNHVQNKKL